MGGAFSIDSELFVRRAKEGEVRRNDGLPLGLIPKRPKKDQMPYTKI